MGCNRLTSARATVLVAGVVLAAGAALAPTAARADSGDLILWADYGALGPEGITRDESDGTFWVPSFIDGVVRHFDADFNLLGSFANPIPGSDGLTGICYYPPDDSLLVVDPLTHQLLEVDKTGVPIGIDVVLPVLPVVNPFGQPFLRGLAFHPLGDGGNGSIYAVESVGSLIYEFTLAGDVIRTFVHPDDPDGYPGLGAGAPAGGIELVLDPAGDLLGFELVGEIGGDDVIHRLDADGQPTGLAIPLTATGATAFGGIARAVLVDPVSGSPVEAIYGTAESSAALFAIDGALPPIAEFLEFGCEAAGDTITLSWTGGQLYDEIVLERDGALFAVLPGDATGAVDSGLADGVHRYTLHASDGTLSTEAVECVDVIGAGQVLASATLPDLHLAIDITEDAFEVLWITDLDNAVWAYDKDFEVQSTWEGPFTGADDELTGIAYRPETETLFLYNAFDNTIAEVDLAGVAVAPPFTAQIPVDPDEDPWVGSLVYDPEGLGGAGELYALELTRGVIYRLALDGSVVGSFVHPEEAQHPMPDPSYLDNYMLGMSAVPSVTPGVSALDLTSGHLFDRRSTRALRADAGDGSLLPYQMPLDAILRRRPARYVVFHQSSYLGAPAAYAVALHSTDNVIFRLRTEAPAVAPVDFLECRQPEPVRTAVVTFANHGPYDAVDIERDGVLIATLAGDASGYTDVDVPAGVHEYAVVPQLGGASAAPRRCSVRIGVGAVLRRALIPPVASPYQLTRDAVTGEFFVSSNSGVQANELFVFDADLQFLEVIPAPVEAPWMVAALAARPTPAGTELWSIAWQVPAPWLEPQEFLLSVQAADGTFIQPPTPVEIPGAGVGVALTYPTGLSHDAVSDTFWFLERNTDTIWQMDPTGDLLQSIPNPLPPLQDFVFNLGLQIETARGSLTVTSAHEDEHRITFAGGTTLAGLPTGEVVPLDAAAINPLNGMVRDGSRLWVTGSAGSIPQLIELQAAADIPAPTDLSCVESSPLEVTLSWTEPVLFDSVVVRRSGIELATLAPGSASFTDPGVPVGPRAYTVTGVIGGDGGPPAACGIVVTGTGPTFIRGDASADGTVDISDAVNILAYLFSGGAVPPCLDAADVDDSGVLDITDPVYLLGYLFSDGPQPPPPFPTAGGDPTGDGVGCGP